MSRFPSSLRANRFVVLGNPENRRAQLFAEAYRQSGGEKLEVVAWRDFVSDPSVLIESLVPGCFLRIESPGENFEVERAILKMGCTQGREPQWSSLSFQELAMLEFERGRVLPLRQWYVGWLAFLEQVQSAIADVPNVRSMNAPREIASMFDKARCHEIFADAGVPTPRFLGIPSSFEDLMRRMEEQRCFRVFLKPCHSSSASGVVALEIGPGGQRACSSAEMVRTGNGIQLFNSLRLRQYTSLEEIRTLVDLLCRERSVAEAWFPKAGFDGKRFDLRVMVIGGRAAHVVVRQSSGPITNLHLGNKRGDCDRLRRQMGDTNWERAMSVCERAAACFPQSLYVAVDLLVAPGFRRFAVAEVNAFGDLLPNLLHGGLSTYAAELRSFWEKVGADDANSTECPWAIPETAQVSATGL
ncbi:STM4014 family protein [Verrucomicrobiota bacterium sgz303538]